MKCIAKDEEPKKNRTEVRHRKTDALFCYMKHTIAKMKSYIA